MLLTNIIVLCLVPTLLIVLFVQALKELAPRNVSILIPQPMLVGSGVASTILVVLLCMRSLNFGVDTIAYAEYFAQYCSGSDLSDLEGSFQSATVLLNTLMLGACRTSLLPAAWALAIVLPVVLLPVPWRLRISYLTAFLFSIIGIELATNALRQGLSVGFMLMFVAVLTTQKGYRRWLALPFALTALLFHISAALFLAAYILARLPWHLFLITSVATIFIIINSLDKNINSPLASNFIYEIQKYAAHDHDEIWIRALAFATVLASLAAPLLASGIKALRLALRNGPYAIATRLSLLCIPSLLLPYFGYRFIYGVYPIILFLTLYASMLPKISPLGHPQVQLLWLTVMNLVALLGWTAGSSYMREVPFL